MIDKPPCPLEPNRTLFGCMRDLWRRIRGVELRPEEVLAELPLSIIPRYFSCLLAFQTWAGWVKFPADQEAHQQVAELSGPSGCLRVARGHDGELPIGVPPATDVCRAADCVVHPQGKPRVPELRAMLRRIEERLPKIKA